VPQATLEEEATAPGEPSGPGGPSTGGSGGAPVDTSTPGPVAAAPSQSPSQSSSPSPTPGPLRVSAPKVDAKKLRQGRVVLTWKVLEAGAGVRGWTVSSQALGPKKAPYVKRASGKGGASASLRLAPGAYRLRLTVTDALGRASTVAIGKVVVPGGRRG
jgi:hypothetical protein